jgi:hypothetical protein
MKALVVLSVLLTAHARLLYGISGDVSPEQILTPEQSVVKGFITGMALDSSLSSLYPCVSSSLVFSQPSLFFAALSDLSSPQFSLKMQGLHSLASLFSDLPDVLAQCSPSKANDFLRLKNAVQVLKHPLHLQSDGVGDFFLNQIALHGDLSALSSSLAEEKWFGLGFSLGSMLAKLCGSGIIISKL